MSWFPLFLYGYGTTLQYENLLTYRITGINQRKLLRKIAQKDWFSSFLNPLPNSSFRRQGLQIAFKWLFGSMQKTSSLRLSASRNVLGNDLLQICSPECSFGSKWWVGIGLGLIGSLSPAHTESMNFGYTELRLTCSQLIVIGGHLSLRQHASGRSHILPLLDAHMLFFPSPPPASITDLGQHICLDGLIDLQTFL